MHLKYITKDKKPINVYENLNLDVRIQEFIRNSVGRKT